MLSPPAYALGMMRKTRVKFDDEVEKEGEKEGEREGAASEEVASNQTADTPPSVSTPHSVKVNFRAMLQTRDLQFSCCCLRFWSQFITRLLLK